MKSSVKIRDTTIPQCLHLSHRCVYIYNKTMSWFYNQFNTQMSWNQLSEI